MKNTILGTQKISLGNDSLGEAKESFDRSIQRLIQRMAEKEVKEAVVSMKIAVTLDVSEDDGITLIPKFDYKVTSSYQEKAELSGSFGGADYEVVDMGDGSFGIRMSQDGQMTLDIDG